MPIKLIVISAVLFLTSACMRKKDSSSAELAEISGSFGVAQLQPLFDKAGAADTERLNIDVQSPFKCYTTTDSGKNVSIMAIANLYARSDVSVQRMQVIIGSDVKSIAPMANADFSAVRNGTDPKYTIDSFVDRSNGGLHYQGKRTHPGGAQSMSSGGSEHIYARSSVLRTFNNRQGDYILLNLQLENLTGDPGSFYCISQAPKWL